MDRTEANSGTREVSERLLATGEVHEKLQAASVNDACAQLRAAGLAVATVPAHADERAEDVVAD